MWPLLVCLGACGLPILPPLQRHASAASALVNPASSTLADAAEDRPVRGRVTEAEGGSLWSAVPRWSLDALPPRASSPELIIGRWPLDRPDLPRPGLRCPGAARPARAPPAILS